MQSCTCATGSRPSTTNLRKDEDLKDEETLDLKSLEVRGVCHAAYCHLQLPSHETVELVDACPFRLAADQLLASDGYFGPEQDSLWWVSRPARPPLALAAANDGALGTDDSRGTREVPPRRRELLSQDGLWCYSS